ncbi:MAG: hypothetical protein IPP79_14140 [Chitinophagaceae bacterium]|nr:hypothetical protein [Chitinophagaceae bacterium]
MRLYTFLAFLLILNNSLVAQHSVINKKSYTDPATVFTHPPESAKPGVLWMWMGTNIDKANITKDLEALKAQGFNRTTMFSLADVVNPWSAIIGKTKTPEIISWTEPWWKLVRFAAEESKRLGMDFGMFNGPGYESSGGNWITPEKSMQEICWSVSDKINGNKHISLQLKRPTVDPRSNMPFPVFNLENGLTEKPEIPGRKNYYKDIAVLALPAEGVAPKSSVIDLTSKLKPDGTLDWDAPAGDWLIYRFGHTTMGALIQPAQPQAVGLECDKMSEEAVNFHMDHIIGEIQKHLGDLIGTGFTHVHFDSYEAGNPTWTPKMREEFLKRRGYDIIPYLPIFAGRIVESKSDSVKVNNDFTATIMDLYRDVYYTTISKRLKDAKLTFLSEPYGGPWRQDDVMPLVHNVMTEFWTGNGEYSPYELDPTVAALRKSDHNLIEAEAFTGQPADSKWSETPAWLKPIGDAAFCAGVNRIVIHRFAHQPFDERYKPGNTMGQWGTHFDRTQTWWKESKALVQYWQRCQALLQWGHFATAENDFTVHHATDSIKVQSIHRNDAGTDIYFVANTTHRIGTASCSFKVTGKQPEIWDAVTGTMKDVAAFYQADGITTIPMKFDDAQSFFIVFRKKLTAPIVKGKNNFPEVSPVITLDNPWQVQFDKQWGGPANPVTFDKLQDWTTNSIPGIKYFSGTAIYRTSFNASAAIINSKQPLYLDLGKVNHLARIILNGKDLGVLWTAPWRVTIPSQLLHVSNNKLEIQVTNVWANRLIGDEQEPDDCEWLPGQYFYYSGKQLKEFPDWFLKNQPRPSKGRYCFTTWNYFTKDSPLIPSGLIGPVRIAK